MKLFFSQLSCVKTVSCICHSKNQVLATRTAYNQRDTSGMLHT